ncbi:peptidylprolyl isomerase [Nostoc sp. DSM 114161]|jgi:parvulin-like peptidyl-prolyl isomerase|uniref:peptidylprolyl isomerase n=1 Tax=Nostoc sp. DSM 114161 TaxID=3440143 RepID=UPI004045BCD0
MNNILEIGNLTLTTSEIIPLLASYNIIGQFLCESIIDTAIAPISCTKEEINDAGEQFYQYWDLTTSDRRQAWISRYDLTQEQFELLVTRKLRVEKFKQATWAHQLELYFLKRKSKLDKIIYSLIRTENQGTANELYFRIKEGEQTFAQLACEYSSGPEAQTGGIVGPVELGTVAPDLAQLFYTSELGVIQPPVLFGELWLIVRPERIISAHLNNFMRQRLLQENFEIWLKQQVDKLSTEEKRWMGINTKLHNLYH